jgi:hypothetical protein
MASPSELYADAIRSQTRAKQLASILREPLPKLEGLAKTRLRRFTDQVQAQTSFIELFLSFNDDNLKKAYETRLLEAITRLPEEVYEDPDLKDTDPIHTDLDMTVSGEPSMPGGKRKTRKSKKSRRKTRKNRR